VQGSRVWKHGRIAAFRGSTGGTTVSGSCSTNLLMCDADTEGSPSSDAELDPAEVGERIPQYSRVVESI
jgi:hypothetical protein